MAQVFKKNTLKDGTKKQWPIPYWEDRKPPLKRTTRKYNRVFFNIQNNMQNNVQSNMLREDEINENYKLVEERETTV